uniref:Uncharacterized protein n=1 Tax=Oryza sativa subsp. japonica TaxID=39947 RepID=Q67U48_ORYSJ|nr:hypothetical protein [Oryza sativa Japonica Group]
MPQAAVEAAPGQVGWASGLRRCHFHCRYLSTAAREHSMCGEVDHPSPWLLLIVPLSTRTGRPAAPPRRSRLPRHAPPSTLS